MAEPIPTLTRYDITDLNNGKIPEFPVDDPPGWDDISLFYAKALQTMGWIADGSGPGSPKPDAPAQGMPAVTTSWEFSEKPDSYFFWGGMHWWPGKNWEFWNAIIGAPQNQYWCHCTHGKASSEAYFLPWHRAYIYFYEVIIRARVKKLGGPDDWALPYWNYSFKDPSDPTPPWPRSCLPWVFTQPKLPDGTANPLFQKDLKKRGLQPKWPAGVNQGKTMFLEDTTPPYSDAYGNKVYQVSDEDGFNPTLDGVPHGMVHVDTGLGDQKTSTTGWMSRTQVAGFDPIFWLHHSQIDRLWVGWNALGGKNPTGGWLTAANDPFKSTRWNFWADGEIKNKFVVLPGEMVNPEKLEGDHFPHSYEYQNLPPAPGAQVPGLDEVGRAFPMFARATEPTADRAFAAAGEQELASADEPVEVLHDAAHARVELPPEAPSRLRGFDADNDDEPPRVILYLENITGDDPGNYAVYLNNTAVDRSTAGRDPHFVGTFSGFGADHQHGGDEEADDHEPHGVSASYDITDLVAFLRDRGEWNENDVTVSIVPAATAEDDLPLITGPITVGRISIRTS
jgi:hypothetical protein